MRRFVLPTVLLASLIMLCASTSHAQVPLKGARTIGEVGRIRPVKPATDVKMRQWWEDKAPLLRRIPIGAAVVFEATKPQRTDSVGNYWYQVSHAGMWGWVRDIDLEAFHPAYPNLSRTRKDALWRGRSAMGFSYWWSNARWEPGGATIWPTNNTGTCTGTCGTSAGCKHTPSPAKTSPEYGSDCSGFVSTIWGAGADQDPTTNPVNNGFATVSYATDRRNQWSTVDLEDALPGDAVVRYNTKTKAGHIFLVAQAQHDRGVFRTYECEGCSAGCRVRSRTISDENPDNWHAIRRSGWPNN